ncbi:MAG: hypothetical protein WDA70_01490 [Lysobacteraceae bacterium]
MTAVSKVCPIIRAFPFGSALWRIDWFGRVGYPDRLIRNSQPSVCVHLSCLTDEAMLPPQIRVWVSIGTLVLLRMGDVWQNQRLAYSNPAEAATFTDVEIDSDPEFIKAGVSEDDHFLLPLTLHPWHKGSTHSYCIRLRLEDDRQLIVPCMELVRFYFGSSSRLLRLLFRPTLRRQDLYDPKTSAVSSGKPHSHVNLAPELPARSAPDVARIAGDHEAWRWAARIGASIAAPHNSGHVRTSFPFSGKTTLQARGVWLPRGDDPDKTFVVQELLHCSHPLPFQRLTYRLAKLDTQELSHHEAPSTSAGAPKDRNAVEDATALTEAEPGHFAAREFRFPGAQRFSDLERKVLFKVRNTGKTTPTPGFPRTTSSIPETALGSPGSSQRIRPAELALSPELPTPDFLQPIIEALGEIRKIRCDVLTDSGADGWTLALADICPDIPEELAKIESSNGHHARRVAVLALQHEDWCIDWVIIEHEVLVLLMVARKHGADLDIGSEHHLHDLLRQTLPDFIRAIHADCCEKYIPMARADLIQSALRSWVV